MFVPPDTQCKDCIFFDDSIDCRIGKFKLYKDKGLDVIQSDNGNCIKQFICPYFRTAEWASSKKTTTNLVAEIESENKLPYIPIILNLTGRILKETLEKIIQFDAPPEEVYVILKEDAGKNSILIREVFKDTNIKWNIHISLEEDSWHIIFKHYNRREFLLIINGYPQVNNKWPKIITKKIQNDLLKFSYAENKNQTMMLISSYVYNAYYFEYGKKFIQMLRLERHRQKCLL